MDQHSKNYYLGKLWEALDRQEAGRATRLLAYLQDKGVTEEEITTGMKFWEEVAQKTSVQSNE